MKAKRFAFLWLCLLLAATLLTQIQTELPEGRLRMAKAPGAATARLVASYGKLPLSFEPNHGQTDAQVKFLSRGNGYTLFLTSTEAVLSLHPSRARLPRAQSRGEQAATQPTSPEPKAVLRMQLVGANPTPQVIGLEELPGKSNYFLDNDPSQWRTNVSTYAKVRYKDTYPGVDLVYYGNQRQLEYDFVVAPGADPRAIQLRLEGAEKLEVDREGDLLVHASGGDPLRLRKPLVYQETNGVRREIPGNYVIQEGCREPDCPLPHGRGSDRSRL